MMKPACPAPSVQVPIIGYVRSPFQQKFGIPRQPNLAQTPARIELLPPYDQPAAFAGLEEFSHVWLIWQFHANRRDNHDTDFVPLIRPPRLGGNARIGVFASRSMYRPSQLGLSVVQVGPLQQMDGRLCLQIIGADLLDGTPVVDIKPYLRYADVIAEARSGYADTAPSHLPVIWQPGALQQCQLLIEQGRFDPVTRQQLEQLLALDPRPAYHADGQKRYGLRYAGLDVQFEVVDGQLIVLALEALDSGKIDTLDVSPDPNAGQGRA